MRTFYALGIDPGKTGAVTVFKYIEDDFYLHAIYDYSYIIENMYLLRKLECEDYESDNSTHIVQATIEQVHAMPKQGVSSTFNFGMNFGWWLGVLEMLDINVTLVSPQTWQKLYFGKVKDTKEASLESAKNMFVRQNDVQTDFDNKGWFNRQKDHGRSDSSLIGWYGIYTRFGRDRQCLFRV